MAADWLVNARWGTAQTPLPTPAEDTAPDPDDNNVNPDPDVLAAYGHTQQSWPQFRAFLDAEDEPSVPKAQV